VETIIERLEKHSIPEPNSGCYLWLGATSKGIPYVRFEGKMQIASRVAFKIFKCDPGALDVCHHCDNPPCINPDHLFAGTALDNMADREAKGRTFKKLTDADVLLIRSLPRSMRGYEIADRFGVSQALVSLIRNNKLRVTNHG
jgi:hypothetical protein